VSDFPTRWRLVLLDGSERFVRIESNPDGPWLDVTIEGDDDCATGHATYRPPAEALLKAVGHVGRTLGQVIVEVTPATEPRRAELVAALRALIHGTMSVSAAMEMTRDLLARCP
jgi:hypothetical protein